MGDALKSVGSTVPWRCSCGASAHAPAFILPKDWVLERSELGTGSARTLRQERVLCKRCSRRERRRVRRR